MSVEQLMKLIQRKRLMDRQRAIIFAHFAEELLHRASVLVHIDDFARLVAHTGPHVGHFAWKENALGGADARARIANLKIKLAIQDVYPFILLVVEMARPPAIARKLEYTHRTICVPGRPLSIIRFAADFDMLTESVVPRCNAESHKHLVTPHFLSSFQVLDGFFNGFNQPARSRK